MNRSRFIKLSVVLSILCVDTAFAQPATTASSSNLSVNVPPSSETAPAESSTGEKSSGDLAKTLQNPIGNVISVPFQNNINFNVGPHKGTQDILNIQPVIPIHINQDWNVITRTILPLVWNPSFSPVNVPPFGLAPTSFSAFLSPSKPVNGWVWGVGPIAQLPTITHKNIGSNVWGLGPAIVVVKLAGPIVAGMLVNNVVSLGGTSGRGGNQYNVTVINPFFNYNFGGGWFVGTVPILTANWDTGGQKWTLPVGAQVGRLIKIAGKLPVNLIVGAYYNALRPSGGATWQLRTQVTLVF
jgi:hypothetical protein